MPTTLSPLYITRNDHTQLRLLVSALSPSGGSATIDRLRGELDRATVIDPAALPADIVSLGAHVKIEDLYTGEIEEYQLTLPEQADIGAGRLSILTPVGTALIGYRTGDIVEWPTPGGIRRLKIHAVTPRAAAAAASPHPKPARV
ncbi:Regulator of nucleoside diphosphate kinase [Lacunisphaera limnophila]|uniref:Regulator of nucleoside diphosphate kinase n=1 Tax=Lacunisphaera limnophila TaxID=1838286 RepID=A0A1D8AUL6_9BACT|nr:GreA/GreB family elongation factor [Lacunisphaera limnophila]AOS44583.1 Regulator of nucleoside diphosphate kinase [Lacunisphaera limnophila]